jgi:hypothetical protein
MNLRQALLESNAPVHQNIAEKVHYDMETRVFIGEASTFGKGPLMGQLYRDACDEGLIMLNTRTGNAAMWFLHDTVKDAEGDIVEWVLHPCSETVRQYPTLADHVLHILND